MKKKPVDYSGFSLRRLNEPRFSHMKLLLGWVFYFVMYFVTENLIPAERCHPIHCALDDLIPFNEFFVIFYVGWYLLVFGSLLYYLLYDRERFTRLQVYIMFTQAVAMIVYILWPSIQDLRPETASTASHAATAATVVSRTAIPAAICDGRRRMLM